MSYYDMLVDMIDKSGLTLQEIADQCEKNYGVKINRSYISKLQTRKQAPASEEVNTAIAKVCGGNVERFNYEAYFEKSPEEIRRTIEIMTKTMKKLILSDLESVLSTEQIEGFKIHLDTLSSLEIVNRVEAYLNDLPNIRAQWQEIFEGEEKHDNKVRTPYIISPKITDNSMEPIIPKGAILHIDQSKDISNGEIVVAYLNNQITVRKSIVYEDKIFLISLNPAFPPIIMDKLDLLMLGKVKSVTIDI